MKKILKMTVIVFALCLAADLKATTAFGYLPETSFQMSFEDKDLDPTPLAYRSVYVYSGDYKFKSSPGFDIYPYGRESQKRHWLLEVAESDGRGKFDLNVDRLDAKTLCFRMGPSYQLICAEKSSDLNHTPSDHHLRIVALDKDSNRVNHNDIYDLKKGTVKTIWPDGRTQEKRYKSIDLTIQKAQK